MGAAVEVAAKGDALRVHFPLVGQAEDLIAARIGEERAIPAHKGVQPAKALNQLVARPQIEMIGVGQHQLCAAFMEVARLQGLDVGLGAHRGKGRHRNGAVGRVKGAQPRQAVGLVQFKSKRHVVISSCILRRKPGALHSVDRPRRQPDKEQHTDEPSQP